jgi:hypothetical protein
MIERQFVEFEEIDYCSSKYSSICDTLSLKLLQTSRMTMKTKVLLPHSYVALDDFGYSI